MRNGMQHPLQQTFDRLAASSPRLQAQLGLQSGPGWMRPAALFTADHLTRARAQVEADYGVSSPNVVASVLLAGYGWSLMAIGVGAYLHGDRVPDLHPDNVCLHWDDVYNYADRLALVEGRFTALPDDPAAGRPGVAVVSDRDALRRCLLREFESHFGLALSWLGEHLPVRERALWPTLADRCASFVFWLLNEVAGEPRTPEEIATEMRALTAHKHSRLSNRCIDLITVEGGDGATHCFYRRATCCHAYRLAGHGYCTTCPHLSREAQLKNVRTAVREKVAAAGAA
ncbi:MAG: ferric iron reductase [Candidatus Promineifilaceae bacterium]|nr:ferric iron reductase [Candidatus Promineifilaceae bacterium]